MVDDHERVQIIIRLGRQLDDTHPPSVASLGPGERGRSIPRHTIHLINSPASTDSEPIDGIDRRLATIELPGSLCSSNPDELPLLSRDKPTEAPHANYRLVAKRIVRPPRASR